MSIHSTPMPGPETSVNTAHATDEVGSSDEALSILLELTDDVLGIRPDPGDNFFDHGDSMAATQLCTLAARKHGWTITPRDLFAWETFSLLAGVIERDRTEHRSAAPLK